MELTSFKWSTAFSIAGLISIACAVGALADGAAPTTGSTSEAKPTPLVVLIHSRECPVCAKVRPMMKELSESYQARVRFVNLDVTDDKAKAESKQTAKSLHVGAFFNMYADTFPCVGIFDSKDKPVHELCGYNPKAKYEGYIKKALEKS